MGARFFPLEVERNDTGKQSGKTIRVGMVLRGAHTSHRRALSPASGASGGHEDERRKACLSGRKSPHSEHRKRKNITYRCRAVTRKKQIQTDRRAKGAKSAAPRLRSKTA